LWSGGDEKQIIKEQTYPGREDDRRHFEFLLTAFQDARYIRVDGKPLMVIYRPHELPNSRAVFDYWRELAERAGLPGLHIVATLEYHERNWDARANGYDATTIWALGRVSNEARSCLRISRLKRKLKNQKSLQKLAEKFYPDLNKVYNYEDIIDLLVCGDEFDLPCHPMAVPNWDTTARYDRKAIVFHNSTPEAFRRHLRDVLSQVESKPAEQRIVFLKSWNEWAEGNYLEPDARHGDGYLRVLGEELSRVKTSRADEARPVVAVNVK
jgi:hypothetical protein